jgi:hypothetical protein
VDNTSETQQPHITELSSRSAASKETNESVSDQQIKKQTPRWKKAARAATYAVLSLFSAAVPVGINAATPTTGEQLSQTNEADEKSNVITSWKDGVSVKQNVNHSPAVVLDSRGREMGGVSGGSKVSTSEVGKKAQLTIEVPPDVSKNLHISNNLEKSQ